MTNYLIKFMLLLMVTFSIGQANATVVYYKNTNNWQTPRAHMWLSGSKATTWPGTAMDNLGDGWYCVDAGNYTNIIFNNNGSSQTDDLPIPQNKSAAAYVDGKWETVTYQIQHPWGVSGELTVKTLTDDGDGYYSLSGKWCDAECDVRCYINGSRVETHIPLKRKISHWRTTPKRAMNVRSLTIPPTNPSPSQKENRCHTKQSTSLVA